jgi:hypothetical protein
VQECVLDTVVLPLHLYNFWIRRMSLALRPGFFQMGPITTPGFLACTVGDTPSCKGLWNLELITLHTCHSRTLTSRCDVMKYSFNEASLSLKISTVVRHNSLCEVRIHQYTFLTTPYFRDKNSRNKKYIFVTLQYNNLQ